MQDDTEEKTKFLIMILKESGVPEDQASNIVQIAKELRNKKFLDSKNKSEHEQAESIIDIKAQNRSKSRSDYENIKPIVTDVAVGLIGSGIYDLLKYVVDVAGVQFMGRGGYSTSPRSDAIHPIQSNTLYFMMNNKHPTPTSIVLAGKDDTITPEIEIELEKWKKERDIFITKWSENVIRILHESIDNHIDTMLNAKKN